MKKYIPLALLATLVSTSMAGDLKNSVQAIRQAVKANPTGYQVNGYNHSDTTFVFEKGNQTIKAGTDYTAFYSEKNDQGLFMFDIGSDGKLERVTMVDGRLNPREGEKAFVEHEGLSGDQEVLKMELRMNDTLQMFGKTPHNTRRVYIADSDSLGTVYDFGENKSTKIGFDVLGSLRNLYKSTIDSTKAMLRLSK